MQSETKERWMENNISFQLKSIKKTKFCKSISFILSTWIQKGSSQMLLYCAQELNNNQSSLRRWEYTVFPPSEALRRLWKAGRLPDFFFLADDGDVCNLRRCEWTRRSTTTAAAASSRQIAPCWLSNVLCATHYVKWKGLITSMHTHTERERERHIRGL